MPEPSTIPLADGTFIMIPDDDGNIDLAPLGVAPGQRFSVGIFDNGSIQLTPVA